MSADEQAIRDVIANWAKATQTRYAAAAHADVGRCRVLTPGREPMLLKEFVEIFTKMRETHRLGVVSDIKGIKVGGELAYCWSHLSVTVILCKRQCGWRSFGLYDVRFHKQANAHGS